MSSSADRTGLIEGLGTNAAWEVDKDPRNNPVELNTVKASNRASRVPAEAVVHSQRSRLSSESFRCEPDEDKDGLSGARR